MLVHVQTEFCILTFEQEFICLWQKFPVFLLPPISVSTFPLSAALQKRTMAEAKEELLVKQGGSWEAPVPEGLSQF